MNPRLDVADGIGTLRLDRPRMNALDTAIQDRLKDPDAIPVTLDLSGR